jgi:hypothetical protein
MQIVVLLVLFFVMVARIVLARISSYRRRSNCKEESLFVVETKKKRLTMPPLSITCLHRSDCRCLCRPKEKKFMIPNVSAGFKRVLVPTPGAKCGAREFIIVHDLQQQQHPHRRPANEPPLRPKSSKLHPTLDAIPEEPPGYNRVLVPVPGTKCAECDCIIVQQENVGKLLNDDSDAVSTTKNPPPPAEPRKILPFEELHGQIIQYSKDDVNWTMSPMRDFFPPECFLHATTGQITRPRKYNFFCGTEGDCPTRLGCSSIGTIAEEVDIVVENLESFGEYNHPTDGHGVIDQDHQEEEDDDSSAADGNTFFVEEDNVQEDVVCAAVAVATDATEGQPEDGTHVFAADSSCNGDLSKGVKDQVSAPQQGSGYYIDDKGRKRRYSLRISAKKISSKEGQKRQNSDCFMVRYSSSVVAIFFLALDLFSGGLCSHSPFPFSMRAYFLDRFLH